MKKLVLPSGIYVIEKDAFVGCENITDVWGNVAPYLEYSQAGIKDELLGKDVKLTVPKFSVMAEEQLKERMTFWQTKKDYETLDQYKSRVTDENRRKRMDEFVEELKRDYVALYAPNRISTTLVGNYDSEYGVYTIQTSFWGKIFVQVPKNEATAFRESYNKVEVNPQFGVEGDTLAITSCQFKLGDKIYYNATNYAGSGESNYNFELPPLDINLAVSESEAKKPVVVSVDDAVDKNIPKSKLDNDKMFALIIGNEQYKRVSQVPYANNDAKVFAEYCKKTLGVPASNVKLYQNASLNDMRHAVTSLVNILNAYDGEARAIVYYAGHGIPDESSQMPYLLPVDGFATDVKSGYSLNDLYDELGAAPSQMTMVLLDACFSGAKRDGQMLSETRGVAIKARTTMPTGNLLVFSASQGNETAYCDKEHGHGMFTYYLLKHLQDTKGETTVSDMSDYVITNVKRSSVSVNDGKIQTPTVIPSSSLMNSWQSMMLK